jgi:hypothetical protein
MAKAYILAPVLCGRCNKETTIPKVLPKSLYHEATTIHVPKKTTLGLRLSGSGFKNGSVNNRLCTECAGVLQDWLLDSGILKNDDMCDPSFKDKVSLGKANVVISVYASKTHVANVIYNGKTVYHQKGQFFIDVAYLYSASKQRYLLNEVSKGEYQSKVIFGPPMPNLKKISESTLLNFFGGCKVQIIDPRISNSKHIQFYDGQWTDALIVVPCDNCGYTDCEGDCEDPYGYHGG